MTAVELLRHRLVDGDRQDEFVVIGTCLYLVVYPFLLTEDGVLQFLGGDVIAGKCQFLVFGILIVVLIGKVGELFMRNDLTHQFDSGVVLTAVALTL